VLHPSVNYLWITNGTDPGNQHEGGVMWLMASVLLASMMWLPIMYPEQMEACRQSQ
jgi:hypothetical protein